MYEETQLVHKVIRNLATTQEEFEKKYWPR